jgi:uncharacterized membrane protein
MKPLLLLGLVSIALGLFLLIRGFTVTERDQVDLGPISATVERQEPVSPWVGGGLVALGAVLLVTAARRRA